jgi:hypothetical protein
MSPTHARGLATLPVRVLATAVATVSAALAVWHGGLFALQALGSPPSGNETRTLLGVGAAVVGSFLVPGWLTVRNYVLADRDEPVAE